MAQSFERVGQAPGSRDCGFFCGYVVGLHKAHRRNLPQMQMSQQDVYAFREAFIGPTRKPEAPGYRWLLPDQMPDFLSSVGVPDTAVARPKTELQSFVQDLHTRLSQPGCWGVLVAFEGQRLEHWVAVLQSQPAEGGYSWICYDPAGNINKVKELCAARFDAHELAGMWLERHRIRSIVA